MNQELTAWDEGLCTGTWAPGQINLNLRTGMRGLWAERGRHREAVGEGQVEEGVSSKAAH